VGELGKLRKTDVRLISATNIDLPRALSNGTFREDLYFRLKGAILRLPPLRDRTEDILPLAEHLLGKFAKEQSKPGPQLSADARALLLKYPWPGNVRLLKTVLEGASLFQDENHVIHASALERFLEPVSSAAPSVAGALRDQLDRLEEQILRRSLTEHDGNVTRISRALGLSRQQLYNKFHKYGIPIRSEE
jgi:transcriptional regulator with PAS, ATPase and Fis domain